MLVGNFGTSILTELKFKVMTENFSTGDILQLHDTNCTKGAGTTLSTVIGIIGAIIVLALLWNAYTSARDTRANTEAIASGTLGNLTAGLNGTQEEVRVLVRNERADAIKLAYNDGVLYGRPKGLYDHGHYEHFGHGHYGHGGCGGHGFHDDCHPRQQFREIKKFKETSDDIELINACGSLRG